VFGNGLALAEWEQLATSPWRREGGFTVVVVDHPSRADVLAVHGPVPPGARSFQERWRAEALSHAKVLWVGPRDADDQADLILVGHPPAPEVLKRALAHLTGRADV
jgi:hypothetical protein